MRIVDAVRGCFVGNGWVAGWCGLELPEALGLGKAVAEVAEAEPGEVGQDYEEDYERDRQKDGQDEGAEERLHDEVQEVRRGMEIVADPRALFGGAVCSISELD